MSTKLNEMQQMAVEHIEGPLLILAGAGSGKTSTMTHRIAYMVKSGIDPYNILAVTFTNKAAKEMRDRVESIIGDTRSMWIMTFHAMCLRMLKYNPEEVGYKEGFIIYDTSDQKTLVKNICKDFGISDKEFKPALFLSTISNCKEKMMDPDDYRESCESNLKSKAIYQVYSEYEKRLKANNAMDFDDLLLNCYKMLKGNESLLLKYINRFRYIMVDEYQDTNRIQYELMRLLSEEHRNICVVGDDDQCIYEWRGADIRNILDFESDFPDAKVIKLEQNYRSKGNILAAAHSVIRNNKGRKDKKLWTDAEKGEKIGYIRCDTDKEEADHIARQINFMSQKGRSFNDFAILYRTNAQSRLFEEAFSKYGVPYRVLSGLRYYDRKEIKDIMSYMRLIVNPADDLSLIRIINVPKRGIGAKTIEKMSVFAKLRHQGIFEALIDEDKELLETLPGKSYDKVKEMVECIALCRQERENLSVVDIYENLLVKSGYLASLENSGDLEDEARLDNLMEFKTVVMDYEKNAENPTTEEFMEQLALTAEADNYDENAETVTLMTMHSAKGLEFPVVFLPGLEDGLFPSSKAFDSMDGMEEERRLCYVGMTRAKERLFLSSAAVRTRYGRTDYTRESQFLREVDKSLLVGDAVYERKKGESSLGISTGSIDGYGEKKAYKPYDALKYAKMDIKKKVNSEETDFAVGDRVSHSKFGEGVVLSADEKIVKVMFDSVGVKKMALGLAPLKKL